MLEACDEIRVNRRLPLGVAASGLGAGSLGFAEPKDAVQQSVRVLRPRVFGDQQEDAAVGCLEGGKKPPRRMQVESADT
jgi:hypothetical protein